MSLDWNVVWAVARKDLMVVSRSRAVLLPMILVPVIMLVLWPSGFAIGLALAPDIQLNQPTALIGALPPEALASMAGLDPRQRVLLLLIDYMLAPIFLIVPMMVAIVIAADSIAGERERKTLEALLYSPTTDLELLAAKLTSAWVPSVAVAFASFAAETVVINAAGWPLMERVFFPSLTWAIMALWVAPAASAASLAVVVLMSSRVRSFQEANQLGGMVVLPVVGLVGAQMAGVLLLTPFLTAALGLALWALALALVRLGTRLFRRTEVISWV